jgi:hypothetical protein
MCVYHLMDLNKVILYHHDVLYGMVFRENYCLPSVWARFRRSFPDDREVRATGVIMNDPTRIHVYMYHRDYFDVCHVCYCNRENIE